ncbi:hypothetical protein Lal_00041258 [Lupinus albus]|nr:hypothetical protein Lal_00041258 [Lupinus albus]
MPPAQEQPPWPRPSPSRSSSSPPPTRVTSTSPRRTPARRPRSSRRASLGLLRHGLGDLPGDRDEGRHHRRGRLPPGSHEADRVDDVGGGDRDRLQTLDGAERIDQHRRHDRRPAQRAHMAHQHDHRVRFEGGGGLAPGRPDLLVDDPPVLHVRREKAEGHAAGLGPCHRFAPVIGPAGGRHEAVVLPIERHRDDTAQGLVVEVGEAGIGLQVLDQGEDVGRGRRLDRQADVRVPLPVGRGQPRDHRQGGGDGGDAQVAGEAPAQAGDLLVHGAGIGHDPPRPGEDPLTLRREALEARAAQHELNAEAVLELLHPGRERLLRDAAGLGRMAEMLLAGQREQEVELVDHADQRLRQRDADAPEDRDADHCPGEECPDAEPAPADAEGARRHLSRAGGGAQRGDLRIRHEPTLGQGPYREVADEADHEEAREHIHGPPVEVGALHAGGGLDLADLRHHEGPDDARRGPRGRDGGEAAAIHREDDAEDRHEQRLRARIRGGGRGGVEQGAEEEEGGVGTAARRSPPRWPRPAPSGRRRGRQGRARLADEGAAEDFLQHRRGERQHADTRRDVQAEHQPDHPELEGLVRVPQVDVPGGDHRVRGGSGGRPPFRLPAGRGHAVAEGAGHHEQQVARAHHGERLPDAGRIGGTEGLDEHVGERRADHRAAAEPMIAMPVAMPRRPARAGGCRRRAIREEAAAPAQGRHEPGLARTRPLQPAAEQRRRKAEHHDADGEDRNEVAHPPVAGGGEQGGHHAHVGAGRRRRLAHRERAAQGQPEHRQAVGHADAEMDGEGSGGNEPAIEAGLGDDTFTGRKPHVPQPLPTGVGGLLRGKGGSGASAGRGRLADALHRPVPVEARREQVIKGEGTLARQGEVHLALLRRQLRRLGVLDGQGPGAVDSDPGRVRRIRVEGGDPGGGLLPAGEALGIVRQKGRLDQFRQGIPDPLDIRVHAHSRS